MLIIGSHKNYCGQAFSRQCTQDFKTIHSRHLDIEEDNIGRQCQNTLDRGYSISTFSNDLYKLESAQSVNDAATRQGFIVDY